MNPCRLDQWGNQLTTEPGPVVHTVSFKKCSSVGRPSFEGPSLVQLYRIWITQRHKVVGIKILAGPYVAEIKALFGNWWIKKFHKIKIVVSFEFCFRFYSQILSNKDTKSPGFPKQRYIMLIINFLIFFK